MLYTIYDYTLNMPLRIFCLVSGPYPPLDAQPTRTKYQINLIITSLLWSVGIWIYGYSLSKDTREMDCKMN